MKRQIAKWTGVVALIGVGVAFANTGSIASAAEESARQGPQEPAYAKGQVIVKYHDTLPFCPHCLFARGRSVSPSLDALHARFGVRRITPMFRTEAQERALQGQGAAPVSRAVVRAAWQAQIEAVRARFARRTVRGPKDAAVADLSHIYLLELPEDADVKRFAHLYHQDPLVAYATPNYLATVRFLPSDSLYANLWGLQKIQMEPAWDAARGAGILAAVIDTGIDYTHPDLAVNMWVNPGEIPANGLDDDANGCVDDIHGCDFVNTDGDPQDGHSHGTHVAGTIGAVANTEGVIGVAPEVTLMAVKGLSDSGSGTFADLAASINYAALEGADVLNNSWGCAFGCPVDPTLEAAIQNAYTLGAVVVFAAGNDNDNVDDNFPENMPETIAVSAFTQTDQKASFSNYGTLIDVAAPGVDILSTVPGASYATFSGTSMACPHVVGLAALVAQLHSNWTNEQIRTAIRQSADDVGLPGFDIESGYGRINAARAVTFVPEDDQIPPAAVTDLAAEPAGVGKVRLTWTATGDDGLVGTASAYHVRSATVPLTDANFNTAAPVPGVPFPKPSGSPEQVTVSGFSPGLTYYFGVKVADNVQNVSALSNVAASVGGSGVVVLGEHFESGSPGWSALGLWHLSTARSNSPVTSQAYNDGVDYATGGPNSGTLTSPPIDLTAATEALLTFAHWYETESYPLPYDLRQVQISTNNGLSWNVLRQWDSTMPNQLSWAPIGLDLSAYVGQTVRIRFLFDTVDAAANNFEGWYVDDVTVAADVPASNQAPVLDPIGNKTVNEGQLLSFTVSATDPDGDPLSYSATNLSPGATFVGQTFSWTPGFDQAGSLPVTFTVSDGGLADSETITITVLDVPQPPALPTGLAAQAVSSSRINLSWNDVANETSYELQRSTRPAFNRALNTVILGANATSYVATGLNANTSYYYRIRACNSAGCSGFSQTASARTLKR